MPMPLADTPGKGIYYFPTKSINLGSAEFFRSATSQNLLGTPLKPLRDLEKAGVVSIFHLGKGPFSLGHPPIPIRDLDVLANPKTFRDGFFGKRHTRRECR